jgi:hypothetical protein
MDSLFVVIFYNLEYSDLDHIGDGDCIAAVHSPAASARELAVREWGRVTWTNAFAFGILPEK